METLLYWIKRAIPRPLLAIIRPPYHHALAYFGAQLYKHPTKDLFVIAVTGTKGKSTVTELITAILEADGKQVASLSTIQFRIGEKVRRNLFKMTTPGRFFVQRFLREAVDSGCTHAVIELTSEGANSVTATSTSMRLSSPTLRQNTSNRMVHLRVTRMPNCRLSVNWQKVLNSHATWW